MSKKNIVQTKNVQVIEFDKDLLGKESLAMYIQQVQSQLLDTIQMISVHDQIQNNCKKALTGDDTKDADLIKQIAINNENLKKNIDNKDYFEKKIAFWSNIQKSKSKKFSIEIQNF